MEMMISMVVIAILMAASMPMLTQFSTAKTGIDKNVMKCIANNTVSNGDGTNWYTDATGNTTIPTTEPCRAAVSDIQYNRGRAFNTSDWYAKNGTATQQTMAKKILRVACDQGGEKACDYFINYCWANASGSVPYCDDTSSFTDLTYYLHLNRTTYVNKGATYIIGQLTSLLPKMITNLLNETVYDATTDPNSSNNLAFELAKPWVYILACNAGISTGCTYAYNHNYNKSCYQIRSVWATAPTQNYNLAYNSSGNTDSIYCDMSSFPSAAITGCNSITSNLLGNAPNDDCSRGWANSYNRTCNLVALFWSQGPAGTYNLTWDGAPPAALVPTSCPIATPACVTQGQGSVCADGTVYAGDYSGHHYYTTPLDQGMYNWSSGPSDAFTNVNNNSDGLNNTSLLNALTNPPDSYAPYKAAQACKALNDGNTYGYTDWYLPARNELGVLYANREVIGNFGLGNYWSSTENDGNTAIAWSFSYVNATTDYKWNSLKLRCVRKNSIIDASCPNIGDTCADGTKYAGPSSTYYLFTTPLDQGQFTWNNGTSKWTYTNANSSTYGWNNYTIINTLTNPPDECVPYNAIAACKYLNSISQNGYTDWYLPASGELALLYTNQVAIGNFSNGYYWSSTESSNNNVLYQSMTSSWQNPTLKSNALHVRCVRRDP